MRREVRNLVKKLNEKEIDYLFISDELSMAYVHMRAGDLEYVIAYLINMYLQYTNRDYDYLQSKEFIKSLHAMQPKI